MKKTSTAEILISTLILLSLIICVFIVISHVSARQGKIVKILIVPGHEPNAGGADEFKQIKERDLNLQLSIQLMDDLSKNSNIKVILARDENSWNKDIETYVKTNETKIMNWVYDMKAKMFAKIDAGEMKLINPGMKHNEATSSAVLYLYGTNKWIAENKIDLVLHVHFNNNPKINGMPNYRGYCMYIPEKQYDNSSSSRIFANYLDEEINKIEVKSNMPQEKNIIIEDQELIATGNYNTLKIPAVVIEYAYIYEPMMISSSSRNIFINKAASSTAEAINKYIKEVF
jgi:N-acetylmuramoyl-L-alanine amidase